MRRPAARPAPRPATSSTALPPLPPGVDVNPRTILDAASAHLSDVAFDSPAARAVAVGALAARIGAAWTAAANPPPF